jgi:hypothetical protein
MRPCMAGRALVSGQRVVEVRDWRGATRARPLAKGMERWG